MNPAETELVDAYIDGRLAESQADELRELLRSNAEARAYLRTLATLESGLRDLAIGVPEGTVDDVSAPPAEVSPVRIMTRRDVGWVVPLAACFVLFFALWNFRQGENVDRPEPAFIATLVQSSDAVWNGEQLTDGDKLEARSLSLESGIVRFQFADGVEVTLRGPAEYELIALGETRLRAGLLTATVPDGAEGFRVDTPSAQVVDLGTAFGIEQQADGVSTVTVFDGEVEVVGVEDSDKRLLTEGETVLLAVDGGVSDVEFDSQPFEKLWPTASGIVGATGAFRLVPPWPRRLSGIQSDTEILVLPEGYAGKLETPCPIDIVESDLTESEIPAGRRIRSFLLQFNPVDPSDNETTSSRELGSRMRRIEGSITFNHPVIGLIVTSKTLSITDEVFALHRGPIRPFKRGLELSPPRTADVVSLSEDRHTLALKLAVFDQFSDHVRVIVDASLSDFNSQVVDAD